MFMDWPGSGRIEQTLGALIVTSVAACLISTAAAAEHGGLIIRHPPDFSTLSLTDPLPEPARDCGSIGAACLGGSLPGSMPDREGLRRDTTYFIGVQFAMIGILYMMPESVSSWSDEEKDDYSLSKWWDHVRHPRRDRDDHFINYVLHPYCGAAYYVRARERGYGNRQAFWYSVILSSAYEFGPEAMFEEPSVQDLIVTPVAGSLLGRYFMGVRGRIETRSAERGYRTRRERWVWALTDPLGAVNHRIDHLLGREVDFRLSPYFYEKKSFESLSPEGVMANDGDAVIGIRMELRW
jgi:hypothetical protein